MAAEGKYPYQATIDAYGSGGFRFAEMSHRGSLLCLPTGMFAWDVTDSAGISRQSLAPVIDCPDPIDVLLIGQGEDIAPFPKDLRQFFREKGIIIEAVATGSAVRTYNVLLNEQRAVAGAFVAVERTGRR